MSMTKEEELAKIRQISDRNRNAKRAIVTKEAPLILRSNEIFSEVADLVGYTESEAKTREPDLDSIDSMRLSALRSEGSIVNGKLHALMEARRAADAATGREIEEVIHEYSYGGFSS